jgi:regulator of replication initiation timing
LREECRSQTEIADELRAKLGSLREANETLAMENGEAKERLATVQLKQGQCQKVPGHWKRQDDAEKKKAEDGAHDELEVPQEQKEREPTYQAVQELREPTGGAEPILEEESDGHI